MIKKAVRPGAQETEPSQPRNTSYKPTKSHSHKKGLAHKQSNNGEKSARRSPVHAVAAAGGVDDDQDADAAVGDPVGLGAELLDDDAAAGVVQTDEVRDCHVVAGRGGSQDFMEDIDGNGGIGGADADAACRLAVTHLCMRPATGAQNEQQTDGDLYETFFHLNPQNTITITNILKSSQKTSEISINKAAQEECIGLGGKVLTPTPRWRPRRK